MYGTIVTGIALVIATIAIVFAVTQATGSEFITDQQYKQSSLQYLEDIRNHLDGSCFID